MAKKVQDGYKLVDVRAAMYRLMKIPGQTVKAKKILKKIGVDNVPAIPEKKYGKVIKLANKAYKAAGGK